MFCDYTILGVAQLGRVDVKRKPPTCDVKDGIQEAKKTTTTATGCNDTGTVIAGITRTDG